VVRNGISRVFGELNTMPLEKLVDADRIDLTDNITIIEHRLLSSSDARDPMSFEDEIYGSIEESCCLEALMFVQPTLRGFALSATWLGKLVDECRRL
jgi:hypothetical protein